MARYSVQSGETSSGITLNIDSMYISSGGLAEHTIINSDGIMHISSGGSANSTTVNYRGSMNVLRGGSANSTTVHSSGRISVSSGGLADNTILQEWSAVMFVSSGGSADHTTIKSNAELHVLHGGHVCNTIVSSSGDLYISNGGVADSTTVNPYGSVTVYSAGTANGILINSAGTVVVSNGGFASGITMKNRGHLYVSSGGVASSVTVMNSSGTVYVREGTLFDTTLDNGYLYVSSGGTANNTTVNSGAYLNLYSSGFASKVTIYSRGSAVVSSGSLINNVIVNDEGVLEVSSGASASSVTVNIGGNLTVLNGGSALNVVWTPCAGNVNVSDGAYVTYAKTYSGIYYGSNNQLISSSMAMDGKTVRAGSMYVMSDGIASNTGVYSAGHLIVSSGGSADAVSINSSGSMSVSNGGFADNVKVYSSGSVTVFNGGIANHVDVASYGHVEAMYGGVISSVTVAYGGYLSACSGGVVNDVTIKDYSHVWVYSNGVANNVVLNGSGYMSAYHGGTVNSVTVNDNGYLYLSGTAYANDLVLNGGRTNIYWGVSANGITANSGAYLYISSATATNVLENGGFIEVSNNANVFFLSNTLENLELNQRRASLHSNTTANNTVINSSGYLHLYGGLANSTVINAGGSMNLSGGNGVASGTVLQGGALRVYTKGTANGTIVSNGNMYVYAGGVANQTIQTGGQIHVSGGTVKDTVVNVGAHLYVNDNGVVSSALVSGNLHVNNGAVVKNISIESGGCLYLSNGGGISEPLHLADGAVVSAYDGSFVNFNLIGRSVQDEYFINNLSLIGSVPHYTVTISADQSNGSYKLAQGAESFTGDIRIGTENGIFGFVTVNGDSLNYENVNYTVTQTNGNLVLTVKAADAVPPEITVSGIPEGWVTQDVVLTVTTNEECTIQYQIGDGQWQSYVDGITVSENGTVNIKATDLSDNVTTQTVTIDKIDKVAPTLNVTGNAEAATANDVVLVAESDDGVIEYYDGTQWVSGNQLTVTENGTYQFRATDAAGNVTKKDIVVDKIDKIAPALNVTGNAAVPTAEDVVLVAESNEGVIEYYDGTKWVVGNQLTVTENGTYQFRATDAAGNVTKKNIVVDKIDKIAPILNVTGNAVTVTAEDVVLVAESNEGVIEYYDGTKWVVGNQLTVTENGTYQFRATDAAGNVSKTSVVVDKIDKNLPVLSVTGNVSAWTNQSVTLVATANSGTIEYYNGTEWVSGNTITTSENGTFRFRVTDAAGRVAEKIVVVDKIDMVAPEKPEYQVNRTTLTNQNVTVSAEFADDSVLNEYSVDGGSWITYTNAVVFTKNGTVRFRSTDIAGNVSDIVEYEVSNIDKVAPTLNVTGNAVTVTVEDVVLVAESDDGVIEYYNGSKWVAGNQLTVTKNGTYHFRATDAAGNVTEKSIVVDKINKNIPTLSISGNASSWTNRNVTLTATADKGLIEYYDGSKWVSGNRISTTENGTFYFRVTNDGLVVEKSVVVDKIDRNFPILSVSANTTELTPTVILTATGTDSGSGIKSILYSYDLSSWRSYTKPLEITSNGYVYFKVSDSAGNVKNTSCNITNIGGLPNLVNYYRGGVLISAAASLNGKNVTANEQIHVSSGGAVHSTIISAGGNVFLSSGGAAKTTDIYAHGGLHVMSGAVASNTTVYQGGYFGVGAGAQTYDTTIAYAGALTVWGGGIVNRNTIDDMGAIVLSSGAAANSTTINSNGGLHVFSGAVASNTIVNQGGFFGVGLGATTYNTTIGYAGALTVWGGGVVHHNEINQWGAIILSSGAIGNYTTINPDGGLHIFDGATAFTTEITSGAFLGIGGGGSLYNANLENTASMAFYDGSILRGWVDAEGSILTYGKVDAAETFINFELGERTADQGVILENMENLQGVLRYSVEVNTDQEKGTYALAGGADSFAGALALYVGDGNDCGTLAVGSCLDYNGKQYCLEQNSGVLALRIS